MESRLHWRLDGVMNEDQNRTRMETAPHKLSLLKHMALNALQKEGSKGSTRGKFKLASRGNAYLIKLLEMC